MTRVIYVDVIGGAAGDMLLAALLDAGASDEAVAAAIRATAGADVVVDTEEVRRGGLRARRLVVRWPSGLSESDLAPRTLPDLVDAVDRAPHVDESVRAMARAILDRLGAAESRVHGMGADEVPGHVVGSDDTLLDAVGVAAALHALGAERVLVSPVPLASGGLVPVAGDHGDVPLPAPATVELLRGFAVRGVPEGSPETVTPTAAAVFAALGEPAEVIPAMTVESVGYGAGTRDPAGRPNIVRVILGVAQGSDEDEDPGPEERPLVVLEANVDDLSPELLADAAEELRTAGALDVWTVPVLMKKGRPGVVLSAMCRPELEDHLRRVFFESTPTFGVRAHRVLRTELDRRMVTVAVGGGVVRVKVGSLRGRVITATPEHDDVAAVATRAERSVRAVYEEAAAAARRLHVAPQSGPRSGPAWAGPQTVPAAVAPRRPAPPR